MVPLLSNSLDSVIIDGLGVRFRIARNAEVNKMHAVNLAIVFSFPLYFFLSQKWFFFKYVSHLAYFRYFCFFYTGDGCGGGMGEGNEMTEVDVRVVTWYLSVVPLYVCGDLEFTQLTISPDARREDVRHC